MTHQQKTELYGWMAPFTKVSAAVRKKIPPVIMPFYHTVSDETLPHLVELYHVKSSRAFRQDLDYLLRHFLPLSMEDFISNRYDRNKAHMLLSFDDGLKECHSIVAPILKEKGIPAAFFINPAFIDDKAWFYRYEASWLIHDLKNQDPSDDASCTIIKMKEKEMLGYQEQLRAVNYFSLDVIDRIMERLQVNRQSMKLQTRVYMTESEVRSLQKDGFHIGAHSQHHPLFSEISADERLREASESADAVSDIVSQNIKTFAYPFTDDGMSREQLNAVIEAGGFAATFGTSGFGKTPDIPHYQRIPMEHGRRFSAKKIVSGEIIADKIKSIVKR
ncbi:MAG: polysaccharide deacetylase family protein [Bacteroidales bacterium]